MQERTSLMIARPFSAISNKFEELANRSSISSLGCRSACSNRVVSSRSSNQNAQILAKIMSEDDLKPIPIAAPSNQDETQTDTDWLLRFNPTTTAISSGPSSLMALVQQQLPVAATLLQEVEPLFQERKRSLGEMEAVNAGCFSSPSPQEQDPSSPPCDTITIPNKRRRTSILQDFSSFVEANLDQEPNHCNLNGTQDNTTTTAEEVSSVGLVPAEDTEERASSTASPPPPPSSPRTRVNQADKWSQRLAELTAFKQEHGHTNVPHNYKANSALARWIKRQRHQYRLLRDGQPSTMTEPRISALEALDFVWDVYSDVWEQKMIDLKQYRDLHGNVNVPCNYPPNPQLAIWVKCQRRQYKLFKQGRHSSITTERIQDLEALGFLWGLRTNSSG